MREFYSKEITGASLRELEEFASWYNRIVGNHPIIVGGWAVYCYANGLGSKDIDVIFLGDRVKHGTLFPYFAARGYSESRKNLLETEFTKIVVEGEREIEVVIDASSSNRTNIYEGRKARLPWSWAVKHSLDYELGGAVIQIPEIELLLSYKLGAILGRGLEFRTGIDPGYFKSKLWKDVNDVLSLAACGHEISRKKLNYFLKESRLREYLGEIIGSIEENYDGELKSLTKPGALEKLKTLLGKQSRLGGRPA